MYVFWVTMAEKIMPILNTIFAKGSAIFIASMRAYKISIFSKSHHIESLFLKIESKNFNMIKV